LFSSVVTVTHKIISLVNHPSATPYGTYLQHSATPGSNQATFSPNAGDNRIHVTGSAGIYSPGYANNINSTGGVKGNGTDTV